MSTPAQGRETGRMMSLRTATLVAATFTSGLSAGLFYTYFFSVMPGLGAADDRTFVTAMQWINVKILNGWFAVAFVGAPVLAVLAAALLLTGPGGAAGGWAVAAAVLCLATVVVTFAANVPLNNALMAAGEPDRIADFAQVRRQFERPWVRWNTLRTVTSVGAFGCLVWALLQYRP
jgi:uncharacterized membrane protein